MKLETSFTKLAGIRYPIVQAPMAGGPTTPELVAAVSNAGALGSLGAGMLSPDAIRLAISRIRSLTKKPFAVNLFVLVNVEPEPAQLSRALELLAPIRVELGLPPASLPARYSESTPDQLSAVLELRPPIVSFTFGLLDPVLVAQFKNADCLVIGTATTVTEAQAWVSAGADAVCAQGSEAGAHRGSFLGTFDTSLVGTMALVPQIVRKVSIPVVAAGGIMTGAGIAASLVLGASAAQLGTAFLSCPEAAIHASWRDLLSKATDDGTLLTRAFSGKPARSLMNDFMRRLDPHQHELPTYPIQNALTAEIRQAAARANRPQFMSLWAGQSAGLSRNLPAAQLIETLIDEIEEAFHRTKQWSTHD